MATVKNFEDLEIWQKAHQLAAMIYELCESNPKIARDFSYQDQIKRAALSISNNIAEGFEYNNNNDFYRYLRIAKGSCGEVRNCLLFSLTVKFALPEDVNQKIEFSKMLGRQIGNLMNYIYEHKISKQKKKNK